MDEDVGDVLLAEGWSLTLSEREQVAAKSPSDRLGFAVQLKFYQNFGRFPAGAEDVADRALAYLGDQVERPVEARHLGSQCTIHFALELAEEKKVL